MNTRHTMRFFEADQGGSTSLLSSGEAEQTTGSPGNDATAAVGTDASQAATVFATKAASADASSKESSADSSESKVAAATPWIAADGTFTEGWTERLPEDLRDAAPTLGKYKTVTDLAKALHNANGLIGKKTLVPGEKSTPEEISAYRQALGIPEKIEDYDIKPDEIPEGLGWNEDNARRFATLGHRHNIPPAAMKALVSEYGAIRLAEMDIMAQELDHRRQAGIEDLKRTWGDDYTRNLTTAQQAARYAGVNADSAGFSDPEVVKGFVRLASMLSDDKLTAPHGGLPNLNGQAMARDIQTNPQNPLHKKYTDGDPDTVQRVRNMIQQG